MKKILSKNDLPKIEKLYTFGRTSKLTSKIVLRIFDIHRYKNLGSDEIKKILDIEFPKAKLNRSTISRTVAKAKKVGLLKPLKKRDTSNLQIYQERMKEECSIKKYYL